MDALAQGDGDGKGVLHAFLRANADAVAHRHARAEVGVREALRGEALHEGAHDAVGARIPSGGNHGDGARLLVELHEAFAVAANVGMDVERVDGVDAQRQNLLGILLARTGGRGEDGHLHVLQLADVAHHLVGSQFQRLVLSTLTAHDACNLEVGGCLQCFHREAPDVAVAHYGCSDFLHVLW